MKKRKKDLKVVIKIENIGKDILLVGCSFIAGWYMKHIITKINEYYKKEKKKK